MSADEGFVGLTDARTTPAARGTKDLRNRLGGRPGTWLVWVLGGLAVAAAQPGLDRRAAGLAAAVVGIAAILAVERVTNDARTRYLRSLVVAIVAVSIAADWALHAALGSADVANSGGNSFLVDGEAKRITLPLLVVLLAPLAERALPGGWRERAAFWRRTLALDRIMVAFALLSALGLVVGVAHGWPHTYVAQDLGLAVFFGFMYVAGRAVDPDVARTSAPEVVGVLLLLGVTQYVLLGWTVSPLYNYIQAACAAALAFVLFAPRSIRVFPVTIAVVILVANVVAVTRAGSEATPGISTITIEVLGAFGVLAYLVIRRYRLVPQWLIVGVAAVAVAGFVGFTNDGRTLRGQYHGIDPSNLGRTFEAHRVRDEVTSSKVSLVLGRGFGSTIDERHAPKEFAGSLLAGNRDLAHVPEVHLLGYQFLLKSGFLGLAWLLAFGLGLVVVALRGLERAAKERDGALVIYAALPLLGIVAALAAAAHLPANPLIALLLGVLVTCQARPPGHETR